MLVVVDVLVCCVLCVLCVVRCLLCSGYGVVYGVVCVCWSVFDVACVLFICGGVGVCG